ncbi:hypothetical protein J6590_018554 [Homalodisca vitripennis]|nr:hypothetical protein J6590_018554 [Homalodisca vitripennis]
MFLTQLDHLRLSTMTSDKTKVTLSRFFRPRLASHLPPSCHSLSAEDSVITVGSFFSSLGREEQELDHTYRHPLFHCSIYFLYKTQNPSYPASVLPHLGLSGHFPEANIEIYLPRLADAELHALGLGPVVAGYEGFYCKVVTEEWLVKDVKEEVSPRFFSLSHSPSILDFLTGFWRAKKSPNRSSFRVRRNLQSRIGIVSWPHICIRSSQQSIVVDWNIVVVESPAITNLMLFIYQSDEA